MQFTIKRISDTRYSVVTSEMMSDGTYQSDYSMRLDGNVLRSHEQSGYIRTGGLLKLTLGPKSLAAVSALQPGEQVTL